MARDLGSQPTLAGETSSDGASGASVTPAVAAGTATGAGGPTRSVDPSGHPTATGGPTPTGEPTGAPGLAADRSTHVDVRAASGPTSAPTSTPTSPPTGRPTGGGPAVTDEPTATPTGDATPTHTPTGTPTATPSSRAGGRVARLGAMNLTPRPETPGMPMNASVPVVLTGGTADLTILVTAPGLTNFATETGPAYGAWTCEATTPMAGNAKVAELECRLPGATPGAPLDFSLNVNYVGNDAAAAPRTWSSRRRSSTRAVATTRPPLRSRRHTPDPYVSSVTTEIPFPPLPIDQSDVRYLHGPDSTAQHGVPSGTVTEFDWNASAVYPGTSRKFWVYVPAQYDAGEPASLMVFQDGEGYLDPQASCAPPLVLDNLIHRGDLPVTIGVFVDPGVLAVTPRGPEEQRNAEYDAFDDRYVSFLARRDHPRGHQALVAHRRPRPLGHLRLQQRRQLRFHRGLAAPRRLPPGHLLPVQLHADARRQPLPGAHPPDAPQAAAHLHAGRPPRPGLERAGGELARRQPARRGRAGGGRLRLPAGPRRRRAQPQPWRCPAARRPPVGVPDVRLTIALVVLLLAGLRLLRGGISEQEPDRSWLAMVPGDARIFTVRAGSWC